MKNLSEKATSAFEKLAKESNVVLGIMETGPNFNSLQEHFVHEVYLWDRKHGMEKLLTPSIFPNLGTAILEGSFNGENTRFAYIAIRNSVEKTLDVYQVKMLQVKFWKRDLENASFYEEVDRDSTATSSAGLSGSL